MNNIMSYHVISCHIVVVSCNIPYIMSYDGRSMSYHLHHTILWSQHVTSHISCHNTIRYDHITDITHIMPYHVILCHIMSYMPYHVISCHQTSPHQFYYGPLVYISLCGPLVYISLCAPLYTWLEVGTNSKIMRHVALFYYVYIFLKESHR